MSTIEIRRKLFDYIRDADDKKVKAIYTMVEDQIAAKNDIWTDEFVNEMNSRTADFESGRVGGSSWEEVKNRAKNTQQL